MSDNTREPDNSTNEDVDVPTSRNLGDVYARAGRVAPQEIPPVARRASSGGKPAPFSDDAPTVAFSPHEDFDSVDVPVARPAETSSAEARPPHPSDAPTTVFEPQSPEVKAASSPSGEPTVMFDAPGFDRGAGFSLPEPGEPPRDSLDDAAPYPAAPQEATFAPAAPVAVSESSDVVEPGVVGAAPVVDARRGTLDFGVFLIRFAFGALLVFASVRTFFQLGGDPGLAGLEAEYANYVQPGVLAVAIPAVLLTAGVFLLLGLVTPVAAALATVGTSFQALHVLDTDGEVFNPLRLSDSVWLALLLVVLSVGLQFTGPGRISLDFGRSWSRRPLLSSWLFAVLGLAGAAALWWFGAGVNPFN